MRTSDSLIEGLVMDLLPDGPGVLVDFGMDGPDAVEIFGALQYGLGLVFEVDDIHMTATEAGEDEDAF